MKMNLLWLFVFLGVVGYATIDVFSAQESTLIVEDDAFTMQDMPNNYGGNPTLHHNGWYGGIIVRNTPDAYKRHGYLKFDLTNIPCNSITNATIRLYHPRTGTNSLVVTPIDNDQWKEESINWSNAPQPRFLSLPPQPIIQGWNEFDVTSFVRVQTDGRASFRLNLLTPQYNEIYFISKEGRTEWRPQLIVTHTGNNVIPSSGPPLKTTSHLPQGSIWLVHKGKWVQYTSAQSAVNDANAGDEIVFGPGRHYQTFDIKRSGTHNAPIIIRGDGSPRPIIDASGVTSIASYGRGVIGLWGAENIVIENLEIKDASSICGFEKNASAIYVVTANNITVRNCYIHHNGNGIFVTTEAKNYTEEFCEVAYNSYVGSGYEHGHYLNSGGTTTIRYNHIHHNGGQGYKDRCQNTILAYNYIHDNGNFEVDFSSQGEFISPQNVLIIGNIIKKAPSSTNQYQIIVFGENRHGAVGTFINNTIIAGASTNNFFNMWGKYDRIVAYNNIFHPNRFKRVGIIINSSDQSRVTGRNNWISKDAQRVGNLTNSILQTDPMLVDVKNGNFHLLPISQCINAGDNRVIPLPDKEYLHPHSFSQRRIKGKIAIGAYE